MRSCSGSSWRAGGASNPPQRGPTGSAARRSSFRVMAWCFGLYGFLESSATTPARVAMLAEMIAVSGSALRPTSATPSVRPTTTASARRRACGRSAYCFPNSRGRPLARPGGRKVLEAKAAKAHLRRWVVRTALGELSPSDAACLHLGDATGRSCGSAIQRAIAGACGRAGDFLFQIQDETTVPCPITDRMTGP